MNEDRFPGGIGKLAGALAKAQGAFATIEKNREVTVRPKESPSYTFSYATLDEVIRATRPALSANGLALTQLMVTDRSQPNAEVNLLRTILAHESGESLSADLTVPFRPNKMQELGSMLTYLRRYSMCAILGVVAEEDDDGNAGDGNDRTVVPRAFNVAPKGAPAERPKSTTAAASAKSTAPAPTSAPEATQKAYNTSGPATGVDSVIQGPKGQTEMPSASAATAPPPATGDSASAPPSGAVSPAFAAKLEADRVAALSLPAGSESVVFSRDRFLTDVRNCAKNELKWDLPKCVLVISKLFGINKLQDLTDPQLTDLRAIMFAGAADGEDAYHAEIASRIAANPGRYQKGAAK